jgi:hypothetical protein
MSKYKKNYFPLLWELIWRNRILKSRIVVSLGFSLFLLGAIPIFQYLEISSLTSYALLFLSGMFYHFNVTIYSFSCFHSYLKFSLNHGVLMKLFALVYLLGLLSSIVSCFVLVNFSAVGYMKIEAGQIYLSFLMSNFVFAPLSFWASSYDFVKINLFSPLSGFYQPRPVYMSVTLVSVAIFSLLVDARREFNWPFGFSMIVVMVIIGFIGIILKTALKRVYINCQKSIME